jgi:TonB family protein
MKEKIRIMKTPPPVNDEDIKSFMDFDDLLRKKNAFDRNRQRIRRTRKVTMFLAAVAVLPSALWLWHIQLRTGSVAGPNKLNPSEVATARQQIADTLGSPPPAKLAPSLSNTEKLAPTSAPRKLKADQVDTAPPPKDIAGEQPVYVQAQPAEGYPALYNYFGKSLRYPPSAVKDSVQGVVNVAFVVDQSGKATQIVIEKSLGTEFDKEVMRLMENMPLWRPALYGGKPVQSKISLPITFSLLRKRNP